MERLCQELTILPTVNMNPCWLLFRRACSFNKTIHDETYETHVRDETNVADEPMAPMKAPERWWPEELGEHPNSAGGQNETRYAFFGDHKRLAVDTGDGKVQLYDTGDHRISGVQQHQSGSGRKVTFTSQHGEVDLATLKPA